MFEGCLTAAFFIYDAKIFALNLKIVLMNLSRIILFFIFLLLLSGCSGTYHAYYQTLKLGFSSEVDLVISLEHVQNSAIDLMEIKRGNRTKAIMALAYIEAGQHKWISGDQAMLILEQGRIVRTLGLATNLDYLSDKSSDPLKCFSMHILQTMSQHTWTRKADWSNDEYGYQIVSNFSSGGEQTLNILSANIHTRLIVEDINYLAQANFIRPKSSWKNYFWFEITSGQLVQSIQLLSPFDEQLELVYLSRIARILAADKNTQVNL